MKKEPRRSEENRGVARGVWREKTLGRRGFSVKGEVMNELEKKAVDILSAEFLIFMREQKSLALFEEDDAIDLLVHSGIRPSCLGFDLQWIISMAQRQAMKEAMQ